MAPCCCSTEGKKTCLLFYDTILGILELNSIYSNINNIQEFKAMNGYIPFIYVYSIIISSVFVIHVIYNDLTCFGEQFPILVYLKIVYSLCSIPYIFMLWNFFDYIPIPKEWKGTLEAIYKGLLIFIAFLNFVFYFISFLIEYYYIKEKKANDSLQSNVNNGPIGAMYPQSNQLYVQPSQTTMYNTQGMYNNQGLYNPPQGTIN